MAHDRWIFTESCRWHGRTTPTRALSCDSAQTHTVSLYAPLNTIEQGYPGSLRVLSMSGTLSTL